MTSGDALDIGGLQDSTRRIVDTLAELDADQLGQASLLPGWTRGHVVAHLVLNGEGFLRAVRSLAGPEVMAMYDSDEGRDADIETLSTAEPGTLRTRLASACRDLAAVLTGLREADLAREVPRVPGGPMLRVSDAPTARRREVEIHHADLGLGYGYADWPDDFAAQLMASATVDQSGSGPFVVHAEDLGREWQVGEPGGPTVSGTAGALGWWLTGRGSGEGLSVRGGELPGLGPWRRATAR